MRSKRQAPARTRSRLRGLALLLAPGIGSLVGAAPAHAEIATVFGGQVPCVKQADGVRFCGGTGTTVRSFDGMPIDVNVALPSAASSGPDGNYPLIMMFHGWGGSEFPLSRMRRFADRGYAVFTMSDRGWGESCGGQTAKTGACANGHNRLMDTRYEVRDAQHFAGLLADENLISPNRIGAFGGSYGGGLSMALAALRDRYAEEGENPDGTLKLKPWTSPAGKPMSIAAATPDIPWTDLAYSLVPNGRTLDYVVDSPYSPDPGKPVPGIMKTSFVTGLFAIGLATSNYTVPAPAGDRDADFFSWYSSIAAGEPYETNPAVLDALSELTLHHSSYYIDDSRPPAPLLISNGFTDDLFPADEALRFYNRTRVRHPSAAISLLFMDHGHQRGQNKRSDLDYLERRQNEWFDHYLKGGGARPHEGVTIKTQTCPASAPSEGPISASSWRAISPGEVRFTAGGKTISPVDPGDLPALGTSIPILPTPLPADLLSGLAYDPVLGTTVADGACAAPPDPLAGATEPLRGATYEFAAKGDGFLMVGSPTVIAGVTSPGPYSEIAARLVDVAPGGSRTLVSRALYRPTPSTTPLRQVFQLHPNGYRFEKGHKVRLELLPVDFPYGRFSNAQLPITISDVELRLPTHDRPNGRQIQDPAPKVVPAGYEPAPGYRQAEAERGCNDPRPRSSITRSSLRFANRLLSAGGRAVDRRCGTGGRRIRGRVTKVSIAVALVRHRGGTRRRCRFLTRRGRLTRARACTKRVYLPAKLGRARAGKVPWTMRRRVRLPHGTYVVRSRATAATRQVESRAGRHNVKRVRVR